MGFVGADLGDLESLAIGLAQVAERLRTTRAGVRRVVHTSAWTGDDAERFRVDFDRRVGPSIELVADLLDDVAVVVRRNADDQREASVDRASVSLRSDVSSTIPSQAHGRPAFMEDFLLDSLDKAMLVGELTDALTKMPWLSPFADALEVAYYTNEYGFWSYENKGAMLDALGSALASRWGPAGQVAWSFASDGAEHLGESAASAYFERHHGMTRSELEALAASGDVRAGTTLSELGNRSVGSVLGDWVWSLWN